MENSDVRVSIIIPVFNDEKFLPECLKGIINQTLKEIEVILVDDGSTDESVDVIHNFASKDERIHLIQQANQGSGVARNTGIKAAAGDYIAFMDADDFYPSDDTLKNLYSIAREKDALICGGSFMSDDGKVREVVFKGKMAGDTFTHEGWIDYKSYQFDYAFYRFIYRRKFIVENGIFFPNYRRYQDPPFMLRAFAAAGRFYAIPEVTYCYRYHQSHVKWTVDKVCDLLSGIEDNLLFSLQNNYKKVYMLNYNRLCYDFCNTIVDVALRADLEGRIFRKLVEIQCLVNPQIIKKNDTTPKKEIICSIPLEKLIGYFSNRNKTVAELNQLKGQIKNEGWFINRKFFRIYTWPVRAAGKALRSRKKGKKK
ncbi:MAG: glycosyltransferase [Clostridia bacterium]|nr:glycosyltransferase [Clostridia bacterium]